MPIAITDADISLFVGQYIWPFIRIGAFFLAVPIIGSKLVPSRTRVILAGFVSFIIAPILPDSPNVDLLSLESISLVVQQLLVGLTMGFTLQIVLHIFVMTGQIVAMKLGLGFASMNDPSSGVTVTVISQYYLMLSTLLFLSVNGHLVMIEYIVDSFEFIPISQEVVSRKIFLHVANLGGWMFSSALLIAMPILTALLVVNLSFGVVSRAAPQMNVFAVGFPITLVFGMFLIWVGMSSFLPNFDRFLREGYELTRAIMFFR